MLKNNGTEQLGVRIPPHNEEAEQAVLASLMIEENTFDKILGIVVAEDFYSPKNKTIFDTISRLYHAGQAYDLTLVSSALKSAGDLEYVGGVEYLYGLTYIIPNSANVERYARQVKDKAKLRELISAATRIHELVYDYDRDTTLDSAAALDESGQLIYDLAKESSHKDPKPLAELINPMYEELERISTNGADITGIPTGFFDMDERINGLQRGALIIIAGRPGMGKSAFALNIAQNVALGGEKSVAVFSLEMTTNQLVQRIMSAEAEVSQKSIQTGRLSSEEWEKLADAGEKLMKMKIFLDDTSNISVMEIRSKCRRLKANKAYGLDLVVIDYLQLMENKRIEQREQQIADISRNLKALAKELDLPVIALAQLNRSVESRTDKKPLLSDLRESGAIEQDADQILFIYREEYYKEDTANKGIAEILISKNRSGGTGVVNLGFLGSLTKFRNLAPKQY